MKRSLTHTVLTLTALTLLMGGCAEKDPVPYVDEDQLTGIIEDTEMGRELFRTDNLITNDQYRIPGDTVWRVDTVINLARTISVAVTDDYIDRGTIGLVREGYAVVADEFEVVTTRINDTVPADTATRRLTRYAYFFKLGDDSFPFLGWDIWAYNGGWNNSFSFLAEVQYTDAAGAVQGMFRGDLGISTFNRPTIGPNIDYLGIRDIVTVQGGARFYYDLEFTDADTAVPRQLPVLSAETASGMNMRGMRQIDAEHHVDTIVSPNPNGRLWNIQFIQVFNDRTLAYSRGWCLPYRVPQ